MATETKYCGTAAEVSASPFGSGNTSWTNPTFAEGDTTGTAATASGGGAWLSYGLKCTNFSFAAVSGTINSILAEIEALQTDSGSTFAHLRIVKGGAIGTDATNDGLAVPTVKGFTSRAASLWGLSWTDSDITGSGFGVALDVNQPNGFPPGITTSVFRVKITVDYTAAAALGSDEMIVATAHAQELMIPPQPELYVATPSDALRLRIAA